MYMGRAEETEAHIGEPWASIRAIRWLTSGRSISGAAKRRLGIWEEAIAWFRRLIEANRNLPQSHFELAAALAQLGRLDGARSVVRAGLVLDPNVSVARARAFWTPPRRDPHRRRRRLLPQ
jgi:tetratricopeptide (TPR) repeat protein